MKLTKKISESAYRICSMIGMAVILALLLHVVTRSSVESHASQVRDVIRAHRFELVDSKNRPVAIIRPGDIGGAEIELMSRTDKKKMHIVCSGSASFISMTNPQGTGDIIIESWDTGSSIQVRDTKGHARARVAAWAPLFGFVTYNADGINEVNSSQPIDRR
ncbi:MAG: hypothetical protein ABJA67_08785 [Chthonomonadales bacterium]